MKNVRTTHSSFVFSKFFNLWREQFLCGVGDREPVQAKVTGEKTPKQAGATPRFRPPAAQKAREGAPALPHRQPCRLVSPPRPQFHQPTDHTSRSPIRSHRKP